MSVSRQSLRHLTRRGLTVRTNSRCRRSFPIASNVFQNAPRYSTAADGNESQRKRRLEEFAQNVDADTAEKTVKDWFGDHANWDHEKLKNLQYVDYLISPQNLKQFAEYAVGGLRPGGGRPSFPLMTQEELVLVDTPYHMWAPAPYNNLNYVLSEQLMLLFIDTDGKHDIKIKPLAYFHGRLQPLKARLWNGMVPMSRERWLARRMDDPQNYRNFFELMQDICIIFEWLNRDQTLDRMRNGYNWLVDKYSEFETAINLRREQLGIEERLNLVGMWAEYYHSIMSTMSTRTRQWLADRVDEVQTRAFAEYTEALERAGSDQEAIGTAGEKYYECVQDLNSLMTRADCLVDLSMIGFKGFKPTGSVSDLTLTERQHAYCKIAETKSSTYQKKILDEELKSPGRPKDIMDFVDEMKNGPQAADPRFRDSEAFIGHYHEGKKMRSEVRKALHGEIQSLSEEYWIAILKERMDFYLQNGEDPETHRWGFACYRLTYKQTDEEWAAFRKRFEADVFKSGQWIEGYDGIADMAGLNFIDGRDVGIAEGDIEAAKKHFQDTYTMLPTLGRIWSLDFLVVDQQSYLSYSQPPKEDLRPPPPFGPCFGDQGGFVRLVDTARYHPQNIETSSPGYKGNMKVLSTLVLEELYPLLTTFAQRPKDLWPLARLHPREVYVGHTVSSQEAWWEWCRLDRVGPMQMMFEQMRTIKVARGAESSETTEKGDKTL